MKTILSLILTLSVLTATAQIHVTPTGSGTGTGANWANATTLEMAVSNANSGQTIWVQGGTYNLSATLVVPQNVRLYGGFAGTETALSQRNFATNRTIIDASQQFAVVTLEALAVLSGVTVQNGVANIPTRMVGGGVLMRAGSRIESSYIINNVATHRGGGVFVEGNAEIYNSVIADNQAGTDGFAVSSVAEVLFRNNTVVGNSILDCSAYTTEIFRDTICAGESVTLLAKTVGTYLWNTGATTASITTPPLTANTTFTVTITTQTFCVVVNTFDIVVNPIPTVTVVANPTSANPGDMVTFTATANPPGGIFTWDDISATTGAVLTQQMPAVGDLQFTVNYSVNGCDALPVMATATNSECVPAVITGAVLTADDSSVCLGGSTTLRLTGGTRHSSEWVLFSGSCGGTELARTVANNPTFSVSPTTTTTYFLRGESCGTQTTCVQVTVTVLPLPMPTTAPSNTLCVGENLTLSNATAGGGTWAVGLAGGLIITSQTPNNVTVSGISVGATSVVFTAVNGCQAVFNLEVLATPTPIAGDTNFCQGQSRLLMSTPAGGTWTTAGGTSATVSPAGLVTASSTLTGNTIIQYIHPTTGCIVSRIVVVHQQPTTPSAVSNQVCVEGSIDLNPGMPSGGMWSITPAHLAEFNAGFTQITGLATGNAVVRYQLNEHCYATFGLTVLAPVTSLSYVHMFCQEGTSVATAVPTGGTWASSASAIATVNPTTGVITGASPGTFHLIYTAPNSCTCTSTAITVNPMPAVITGNSAIGLGFTTQLTTSPPGGVWSSLNPAVATVDGTGLVTGISSGTTIIRYTLPTGNCYRDFSISVDACAMLSLAPGSIANQSVCLNTPMLNISYMLTNATQTQISWLPVTPTGVNFNPNTHTISGTPTMSGVFTYTITSVNHAVACSPATVSGTLTVFDAVLPGAIGSTLGTNFSICSGDVPVEFTSTTAGSGGNPVGASYQWQTSTNNVVFTNVGVSSPNFQSPALTQTTFFRRLFINTCAVGEVVSSTITVNVLPVHVITPIGNTNQSVCQGAAITAIGFGFSGGAVGGTLTWTGPAGNVAPAGISASATSISGAVAISATPGTYNFTVTSTPTGGACPAVSYSGSIAIEQSHILTLTSATATANQTVGINQAITNIVYTHSGATAVAVTWTNTTNPNTPPTGITVTTSGTTTTISGTLPAHDTWDFSITTVATALCPSASPLTGTLTRSNFCNENTPGWGASLGAVSWGNTSNTNIESGTTRVSRAGTPPVGAPGLGTQIWSGHVFATACAKGNATDNDAFNGGVAGNFNADCRQSLHAFNAGRASGITGDFFSWCAVDRFGDQLCPYPWRVPTTDDFRHLHWILTGNVPPEPNGWVAHGNIGAYMPTTGTNAAPTIGGGANTWGGVRFAGWSSALAGEGSLYWSSTDVSATNASTLGINATDVHPEHSSSKKVGFQLRCVRDQLPILPNGCNQEEPGFGASLGTVTWGNTSNTNIESGARIVTRAGTPPANTGTGTNTQAWSGVVFATACAKGNATSSNEFNGGATGSFSADCRQSLHSFNVNRDGRAITGDFFSWCAAMRFADVLCPYPWRVPTTDDFRRLHWILTDAVPPAAGGWVVHGNTGAYMPTIGTNVSPTAGGGANTWGGIRFAGWSGTLTSESSNNLSATEVSATNARHLGIDATYVTPENSSSKALGFQLRCVRDTVPSLPMTGCNTATPLFGGGATGVPAGQLGTVTWGNTTNTNIEVGTTTVSRGGTPLANAPGQGTQTWSGHVFAQGCAKGNATNNNAFDGGVTGNWNADCRQSLHTFNEGRASGITGDLFSWCAVMRFADVLCPVPWRVPTADDFKHLHWILTNQDPPPIVGTSVPTVANTYIGTMGTPTMPQIGGAWEGVRFSGWTGTPSFPGSYYWSSAEVNAVNAIRLHIHGDVMWPRSQVDKAFGAPLRCVR